MNKTVEGTVFMLITNLCVANTPDVHALCLHPHTQLCIQSVIECNTQILDN